MSSLQRDPFCNVIQNGIKGDIEFNLTHKRYRATLILIFSGIDAMAFLDMASDHTGVTRDDFINWADKYLHFPGPHQVTGIDFYSARCALLHNYSEESGLTRTGKARKIAYMNVSKPEVRSDPKVPSMIANPMC